MNYFIDAHNELFHHSDDIKIVGVKTNNQTNLNLIKKSDCKLFFGVLYTDGRFGYRRAFKNINFLMDKFANIAEKDKKFSLIKEKKDLDIIFSSDKIGILFEIEGTKAIKSLENFDYLYDRGLRCLTITHNYKNYLGCGVKSRENCGISNLYKSIIKNYQNKPLLIDLAHINQKGFYDVLKITNLPIIVSHGNCYSLCQTKRNLTDNQIKKIAERNGVVGITFAKSILTNKKESSINDVVNHIEYVSNLVGIDYVGIGSDFGGILSDVPLGLENMGKTKNLEEKLKDRGFNKKEIRKIMGENFIRVLESAFK